jgi:signal peptide peptidase SppA
MGLWACAPRYLTAALGWIRSGTWHPLAAGELAAAAAAGDPVTIDSRGVATIRIHGPMMKGDSKYGGVSTVRARRALRAAATDSNVRGIMLDIDSPGGHVAGTEELSRDVSAAARKKPVHAHIDDMGASAALWVASQASRISANSTASVGSIGVFAVLYDESERMDAEGVKVHVISTGEHKGAGAPGAPITDAQLADFQAHVDGINNHFRAAMTTGRAHDDRFDIDAVSDGRTFLASDARALGIIDAVNSADGAMRALISSVNRAERIARAEAASNRIDALSATVSDYRSQ